MKKLLALVLTLLGLNAWAEDGSRLWMRYDTVRTAVVTGPECLAAEELRNFYPGGNVKLVIDPTMGNAEAYRITDGTITAGSQQGLLYGAYALLERTSLQGVPLMLLGTLLLLAYCTAVWRMLKKRPA